MAISNSLGFVSAALSTFPDVATRSSWRQQQPGRETAALRIAKRVSAAHTVRARAVSAPTRFPQTMLNTARVLKPIELFRGLSLSACGDIAMAAGERVFARDETIFREGEPIRFVCAVVSGRVKTVRSNRAGKLVILHLAGPGEVLARWFEALDGK
jgi:CRP-like cAMP-binding protein